MIVPEAVHDAEELYTPPPEPSTPFSPQPSAGPAENWLDEVQGTAATPTASGTGGEARRPCPECGEMIVAGAAKCRFCDAVFDPRLRGTSMHRGQSYQGFAITSLVLGIVSLFTSCFGIAFGIVAIIFAVVAKNGMTKSKNFEGKGMATAGVVTGIIGAVFWTIMTIIYFVFLATLVNAPRHHF
jgi:hypothetical protein